MKQDKFQKKDKDNIKKYKEKGSITLYVLVACVFFCNCIRSYICKFSL